MEGIGREQSENGELREQKNPGGWKLERNDYAVL